MDKKYGKRVIKEYSNRLIIEIEKVPALSGKLTWSYWYEYLTLSKF